MSDLSESLQQQTSRKQIFHAIDTNALAVCQQLILSGCNHFVIRQANSKSAVKIVVNNDNEISNVRDALNKASISYHEYKFADEKQRCFLIKGLVGIKEDELLDIKNELTAKGLPMEIELSLFITGFMRANSGKSHNQLVKLIVPPNFDAEALSKIRCINHIGVRIEVFKAKNVMQCKNCQRFGHSAGGWMHQHRCVKCGANHLREDCPRTFSKAHKLKCCNCGGEHTANNLSDCTFYQGMYRKNERMSKPDNPVQLDNTKGVAAMKSLRNSSLSFASVVSNKLDSNTRKAKSVVSAPLKGGPYCMNNIEIKIDALINMLHRHEGLLAKLLNNG